MTAGATDVDPSSSFFVIVGTASPPVGAAYHKVGYRTGWTTGFKHQSCVDHETNGFVTRCSDQGTAWADGGDSGGSVFVRLDSNNVDLIGTSIGRMSAFGVTNQVHVWSPYSRIYSDMVASGSGGILQVTRPANLATPYTTADVNGSNANVYWSTVSGATEYEVITQEFVETCDGFGCYVTGYPETRTRVLGTSYSDTRGIFSRVLDPSEVGYNYTSIRIVAKNPADANYSPPSEQRFAQY